MTYLKTSTFEFTVGFTVGLALVLALVLTHGFTTSLTPELVAGLTYGLAFGLPSVVVAALGDTSDPHATGPWTLLTRDRTVTLIRTGTTIVLVAMLGVPFEFNTATTILIAPIRLALSTWGSWLLLARLWLPLTGRLPWRPKRFLEDAIDRGVLRTTGAVYQFRHARIRDHLAERY